MTHRFNSAASPAAPQSREGHQSGQFAPASAPLVSIITPTFNRERTITQAVESVLAQSYPHWELIIVDDGSQDGTREKLASYLDDERIQYHFQQNQGQSIARNLALQYARCVNR